MLYLSTYRKKDGRFGARPSAFLSDIDTNLLDCINNSRVLIRGVTEQMLPKVVFEVGDKVRHKVFGIGEIVKVDKVTQLQGGEYCLVNMFYKKIENIETYGIDAYLENRAGKDDTENTLKVYEYYKQLLKVDNYIYYDEQISKAIELFENKPNILKMYQNRFKYIMVDEFQDVNEAQFKMVKMLAGSKENVVCVGDSDQSIYSWRGGDPSFALNFKDYFPSAEIVFMVDNFRCTKSIADVANTLISNNTDRYNKNIAAHKDGMPVWFYDLKNNPSEDNSLY